MHPLPYLLLRLIRRFQPEGLTRFLLRRSIIIRPGRETTDPKTAAAIYADVLRAHDLILDGKRVLVFGYGGRFAIAAELLQLGAAHVVLCDKFAPPDEGANRSLPGAFPRYFSQTPDGVRPNPETVSLLQADIRDASNNIAPVDVVVSNSVYEHLPADNVAAITAALAALTSAHGVGIHFIDLRDHFFKYPFEMLTFSEQTWRRWLNPTSNLNRYRLNDYARVFENHFAQVHIDILTRAPEAFEAVRPRLRAEFLTGDPASDSVTQIKVICRGPRGL
jgi:hypothetical protein